MIYAAPMEGVSIKTLEKEIYSEMDKFRKEIGPSDIDKAINLAESSFIFSLDSNNGIASQLSYYQTVFKDWKYMADYLDNLKRVSINDIQKTYFKYIKDNNKTVATLHDEREK
jgi:predicted Zn-dependent peptidase